MAFQGISWKPSKDRGKKTGLEKCVTRLLRSKGSRNRAESLTGLRAWTLHSDPREPPEWAKCQPHLLGWWPGHKEATREIRHLPRRCQLIVPELISIDWSDAAPHKGSYRGGSKVPGAREMERTRKSLDHPLLKPNFGFQIRWSEWTSLPQTVILSPNTRCSIRSFGQFLLRSPPSSLEPNGPSSIHPSNWKNCTKFGGSIINSYDVSPLSSKNTWGSSADP